MTRYARGERERAGCRNGHAELTVKTTAGPVVLERPKLRGTAQPFASRLLGKGVSRTNALEALVISGFVRGRSVRDVEAALGEVLGPEAALSKSTVSRICQAIKDEFDAWKTRDLGAIELEYLFLDGSHFGCIQGRRPSRSCAPGASPLRAARCCWAGTRRPRGPRPLGRVPRRTGRPRPAGAAAGDHRRRTRAHRRGRGGVLAVAAAALPGAPRPQSPRQGPHHAQDEVKAAFWQIFDDITADPGQLAVDEARRRAEAFVDRYAKRYPAAVACLLASLPELTTFLRFPREHWQRIRHTNLIETFGETRRRIKVIGRLPGERSCLSLVWAVLDRASRGWRGVVMTPAAVRLLQELRRQLHHPARLEEVVDQTVTPAA